MEPVRAHAALFGGAALLAASGCASQMAALAPVGGGDITALRIATVDVLIAKHIDMAQVPVCTEDPSGANGYSCAGTTVDGRPISVTAPYAEPTAMTMTVSVGGTVVYAGLVVDPINRAADSAP